ncbi:MAG: hypothetical protein AAFY20_24980 [Cyanobacteria bacterium J06639_14]
MTFKSLATICKPLLLRPVMVGLNYTSSFCHGLFTTARSHASNINTQSHAQVSPKSVLHGPEGNPLPPGMRLIETKTDDNNQLKDGSGIDIFGVSFDGMDRAAELNVDEGDILQFQYRQRKFLIAKNRFIKVSLMHL